MSGASSSSAAPCALPEIDDIIAKLLESADRVVKLFEELDESGDRRLQRKEFEMLLERLGIDISSDASNGSGRSEDDVDNPLVYPLGYPLGNPLVNPLPLPLPLSLEDRGGADLGSGGGVGLGEE